MGLDTTSQRRFTVLQCADYNILVYSTQCHSGEGTNEQEWDLELAVQAKICGAVAGPAEKPDKIFQEGVPGR